MHDSLKGYDRFDELYSLAFPEGNSETMVHAYLNLGKGPPAMFALEIQTRLKLRGKLAFFDPHSVEESKQMILGCDALSTRLIETHGNVVSIDAYQTVDIRILLNKS